MTRDCLLPAEQQTVAPTRAWLAQFWAHGHPHYAPAAAAAKGGKDTLGRVRAANGAAARSQNCVMDPI